MYKNFRFEKAGNNFYGVGRGILDEKILVDDYINEYINKDYVTVQIEYSFYNIYIKRSLQHYFYYYPVCYWRALMEYLLDAHFPDLEYCAGTRDLPRPESMEIMENISSYPNGRITAYHMLNENLFNKIKAYYNKYNSKPNKSIYPDCRNDETGKMHRIYSNLNMLDYYFENIDFTDRQINNFLIKKINQLK